MKLCQNNIKKSFMDTSEKSSTQRMLYGTLDSWTTDLSRTRTLKQLYSEKPIVMHRTHPGKTKMSWPAVIRAAYAKIWEGKHTRIIIKAPRGGGKSKLLGTVGFDFWYLKGRSVVNMGGSAVQAQIVYNYFKDYCDIDASIAIDINGEPKAIETKAVDGNTFSSVTASTKQVRGKHPDVLISDETCETSDELIDSALPMVNDSKNPLVVMASTFHKIFGRFAETWDNAAEKGYLRIQWDIFDVAAKFPADYFENGVMSDGTLVRNINGIEKLKKYAKGRTGDPEGWITIEAIVQGWREKPSENWYEIEYLGTRPSTEGLVLKPEDVDRAVFDSSVDKSYNYVQGATCVLGIDWGFSSMTAVTEVMAHKDDVVVLLNNRNYHQTSSEDIINEVVEMVKAHGVRFIYADSAGKFENVALQNALSKANEGKGLGCSVIEVVFSKEKFGTPGTDGAIGMIGNLRAHFEQAKIKMEKKFRDAYYQLKNYRYQEGTDKPVKKDDHIPDSLMCALQHFILGQYVRSIPAQKPADKEKEDDMPRILRKPITAGLKKKQF